MSELGKRVAVAAVGIPTVLALLYVGGWVLAAPLAGLAALGALELFRFAEAIGVRPFRALGAVGAGLVVLFASGADGYGAFAPWALALLVLVAALALGAALVTRGPEGRPLGAVAVTLFGVAYAGLSLAVVPLLHALPARSGWVDIEPSRWAGLAILTLPLAATWVGDAAAYFAGSAWGKSKLAPSISPKKSWVGFWAGVSGATLAAIVWLLATRGVLPGLPIGIAGTLLLGVLLGVGAVVGDLAESLLKREAKVKDSGTFFPGHGGVLDRLDALAVTLPLAYVALALVGWLA